VLVSTLAKLLTRKEKRAENHPLILDNKTYSPRQLRVLGEAFEMAWPETLQRTLLGQRKSTHGGPYSPR